MRVWTVNQEQRLKNVTKGGDHSAATVSDSVPPLEVLQSADLDYSNLPLLCMSVPVFLLAGH
jgi:hypothetical protein